VHTLTFIWSFDHALLHFYHTK
jgi:hypothetical protein